MKRVFGIHELPTIILKTEAGNALNLGQVEKAERLCQIIFAKDPKNFQALYVSGVIRAQRGDFHGSLDLLGQALTAGSSSLDCARAMLHYANALRQLGKPSEALDACSKAIEIAPGFALARFIRADMYYQAAQYKEALGDYHEVEKLSPNLIDAGARQRLDQLNAAIQTPDRR